ncbi:serine protease inhibitor swm-1-like, partial [Ixodes scapularis]|uniref:serine protease inhibitor swm-1-like n=1 Tax=Ixodes scapularis TaxID=6945 RepID=UPI001A9FCA53
TNSLANSLQDHVKNLKCRHRERLSRDCRERDRYCHEAPRFSVRQADCSKCVCRPGYLRNSWGDCITQAQCNHCKNRAHLNEDYNLCESRCPLVCHRPIRPYCSGTCYMECACKPGFIRRTPKGLCVPFDFCLPLCPGRNQVFSTCLHNCQEGCQSNKRRLCTPYCAGEGCMCKPGYVVLTADPLVCVRRDACPGRRQHLPHGLVNKG